MSMRDEYRTRAAEFQARALYASDETARHHFKTMANHYLQLAEIERQLDCLRDVTQEAQFKHAS
jgi:gluconate kinase